eukprot:4780783-Pleurochrysis_carterae.AAC.2
MVARFFSVCFSAARAVAAVRARVPRRCAQQESMNRGVSQMFCAMPEYSGLSHSVRVHTRAI